MSLSEATAQKPIKTLRCPNPSTLSSTPMQRKKVPASKKGSQPPNLGPRDGAPTLLRSLLLHIERVSGLYLSLFGMSSSAQSIRSRSSDARAWGKKCCMLLGLDSGCSLFKGFGPSLLIDRLGPLATRPSKKTMGLRPEPNPDCIDLMVPGCRYLHGHPEPGKDPSFGSFRPRSGRI